MRLSTLLDEAGVEPEARWVVAEGADAAAMSRSIPSPRQWMMRSSVSIRTASECGLRTVAPDKIPMKTVGSFWPYATTLFDYVRRAMPFQESKSLTADELYAVSAYILNLNGIVGSNDVLDAQSLPKVRMPNRDGFIPFPRNTK